MLYACIQTFDVTGTVGNFLRKNIFFERLPPSASLSLATWGAPRAAFNPSPASLQVAAAAGGLRLGGGPWPC